MCAVLPPGKLPEPPALQLALGCDHTRHRADCPSPAPPGHLVNPFTLPQRAKWTQHGPNHTVRLSVAEAPGKQTLLLARTFQGPRSPPRSQRRRQTLGQVGPSLRRPTATLQTRESEVQGKVGSDLVSPSVLSPQDAQLPVPHTSQRSLTPLLGVTLA